jgi:hypothetical protein
MTKSALALVDEIAATRAQVAQDPSKLGRLQELQRWQVERLQLTYADLATDPRHRAALAFFIEDLYGPHDFTQRHRDLMKVLKQWERLLGERALQAVMHALELEALSQSLDLAMLAALGTANLTVASYAAAYRRADRREDRQKQIWLTLAAGRELDALINVPGIGVALRAARLPARMIGVSTLQEFLERGYRAFKAMGGAQELLRNIEQRETAVMQRLLAGSADPFRIDTPRRTARTS